MRCFYCLKLDIPTSDEHVVPQFLGTFYPDSLLISEDVCEKCNNFFSRLETEFKEDSIEGRLAVQYRLRQDSSARFRNANLKVKQRISGSQRIFDKLIPVIDLVSGQIKPISQIVIEDPSGRTLVFFLDGIRNAKTFARRIRWVYVPGSAISVFNYGNEGVNELISELQKRGIPFHEKNREMLESFTDGHIDCEYEYSFGESSKRLMAKIAFNYFAYCTIKSNLRDILFDNSFNAIKAFIMDGTGKDPVRIINQGLMPSGNNGAIHCPKHFLGVYKDANKLIGDVSLFGLCRYSILLGPYPFKINSEAGFGAGHGFDLVERKFHRADTRRYAMGDEFSLF